MPTLLAFLKEAFSLKDHVYFRGVEYKAAVCATAFTRIIAAQQPPTNYSPEMVALRGAMSRINPHRKCFGDAAFDQPQLFTVELPASVKNLLQMLQLESGFQSVTPDNAAETLRVRLHSDRREDLSYASSVFQRGITRPSDVHRSCAALAVHFVDTFYPHGKFPELTAYAWFAYYASFLMIASTKLDEERYVLPTLWMGSCFEAEQCIAGLASIKVLVFGTEPESNAVTHSDIPCIAFCAPHAPDDEAVKGLDSHYHIDCSGNNARYFTSFGSAMFVNMVRTAYVGAAGGLSNDYALAWAPYSIMLAEATGRFPVVVTTGQTHVDRDTPILLPPAETLARSARIHRPGRTVKCVIDPRQLGEFSKAQQEASAASIQPLRNYIARLWADPAFVRGVADAKMAELQWSNTHVVRMMLSFVESGEGSGMALKRKKDHLKRAIKEVHAQIDGFLRLMDVPSRAGALHAHSEALSVLCRDMAVLMASHTAAPDAALKILQTGLPYSSGAVHASILWHLAVLQSRQGSDELAMASFKACVDASDEPAQRSKAQWGAGSCALRLAARSTDDKARRRLLGSEAAQLMTSARAALDKDSCVHVDGEGAQVPCDRAVDMAQRVSSE